MSILKHPVSLDWYDIFSYSLD